jgi:hypothetical protein
MKLFSGSKYKLMVHGAASIVLGAASLVPIARAADADVPMVQTVGNISYVSGGIGLDAISQLDSMSNQFNLKLIFALRSGEWLSDVSVQIADAAGRPLLDTVSQGPWFLLKLPAGRYQVSASFAGKAERRTVAVGTARLTTADFRWSSEYSSTNVADLPR